MPTSLSASFGDELDDEPIRSTYRSGKPINANTTSLAHLLVGFATILHIVFGLLILGSPFYWPTIVRQIPSLSCTTLRLVGITTRSVVHLSLPTQVLRLDKSLAMKHVCLWLLPWISIVCPTLCYTSHSYSAERPNFVFLIADDHRYDAMSCVQHEQAEAGRFPWFKTPNMDRLAAEGTRFRNSFVTLSLCSPSRACFLTGQYGHRNGIWNNTTPLGEQSATYASLLQKAGYSTGYVGKWHMGNQSARPGFDWFASPTGQSRYLDPIFLLNGTPTPQSGWIDDISGDFAVRFLESERNPEKPFLLSVGFKSPHGPFDPPTRLKDIFSGELSNPLPNHGIKLGFNPQLSSARPAANPEGKIPVNLNYFRCIAGIDENVGKILKALDRLGLSQNTVVVYTSDNGF